MSLTIIEAVRMRVSTMTDTTHLEDGMEDFLKLRAAHAHHGDS